MTPTIQGDSASPSPASRPAFAGAAPSAFRQALRAGDVVDGYRIERVVHASAQAVVYAAIDPLLGTTVAIKEYMPVRFARRDDSGAVLPFEAAPFARGLAAFIAAARVLARCDQAALVRVLSVAEANGTAYQVMPWVAGTSLLELRQAMPDPPDEPALRALLGSLMDAAAAVHAAGAVHGGIDAAQILMQPDDSPVLLGPGAAARARRESPSPGADSDVVALAQLAHFCITGLAPGPSAEPLAPGVSAQLASRPTARYSPALLSAIDQAQRSAGKPPSLAGFRAALAESMSVQSAIERDDSPTIQAERARLRQFVDSIDFSDADAPRLIGPAPEAGEAPYAGLEGARTTPRRVSSSPLSWPSARSAKRPMPWGAVLISLAALSGAIAVWAVVRAPAVKSAQAVAVAVVVPVAVSPVSPPPEAVLPAAAPQATAVSPAQAPASSAASAATEAPLVVAPPPSVHQPTVKPVKRFAPPARVAAATPHSICGTRIDSSLYRCMQTQCATSRWSAHAQCVRLRKTGRVSG